MVGRVEREEGGCRRRGRDRKRQERGKKQKI
jgi:hypothetical protein